MTLRTTILANVATTAILVACIFIFLHLHHLRERARSDGLYVAACQAYERFAALDDSDESQFYAKYKEAGAAYTELIEFDDSHTMLRPREVERRDQHLVDCIDTFLIWRVQGATMSQGMKARTEQRVQKCAIDPSLRPVTDRHQRRIE